MTSRTFSSVQSLQVMSELCKLHELGEDKRPDLGKRRAGRVVSSPSPSSCIFYGFAPWNVLHLAARQLGVINNFQPRVQQRVGTRCAANWCLLRRHQAEARDKVKSGRVMVLCTQQPRRTPVLAVWTSHIPSPPAQKLSFWLEEKANTKFCLERRIISL